MMYCSEQMKDINTPSCEDQLVMEPVSQRRSWIGSQRRAHGHLPKCAPSGSRLSAEEQAQKIQACFAHAAELGWFCREQLDPSSAP